MGSLKNTKREDTTKWRILREYSILCPLEPYTNMPIEGVYDYV